MDITSALYILFIFLSMVIYWNIKKKYQWIILLIGSLLFYVLSAKAYTLIYVFVSLITVYCASLFFASGKEKILFFSRKSICVLTVLINIGLLAVLKYSNFAINTFNILFHPAKEIKSLNFITPLAISYYTLQIVSYLLDSYWGIITPQKNFGKFSLFVLYFPQMVSGPISRYSQIGEQLTEPHSFDYEATVCGFRRIAWGLFKKLAIANRLALLVNPMFNEWEKYNGIFIPFMVIMFSLQLYADFSGCMDIILGASQCFGINLPENFKGPFFARSVQEFWQRWHITLGLWLKDYIMNPILRTKFCQFLSEKGKVLFGKKNGKKIPAYFGMFFVWSAMGIWHGNGWKYIAGEGWWYFIIIVSGQILKPLFEKTENKLKINSESNIWITFQRVRTFLIFCVGNLFFRAISLKTSLRMLKESFKIPDNFVSLIYDIPRAKQALIGCLLFLLVLVIDYLKYKEKNVQEIISAQKPVVRWILYWFLLVNIIFAATISNQEFLYAQF